MKLKLSTEELGEYEAVDASAIEEVLRTDAFGKFAILSASEEEFMQAGCNWNPSDECARFLKETRSDPWHLEYREGGTLYRARGERTLDEVIAAFLSYLAGDDAWRTRFWWLELRLNKR